MFELGSIKGIVACVLGIAFGLSLIIGSVLYVGNKMEREMGAGTDAKVSHFSRQIRTIEHDGHLFVAVILPNGPGTIRNIIHHPDCWCFTERGEN